MSTVASLTMSVIAHETINAGSTATINPVAVHRIEGSPYTFSATSTINSTESWSSTITLVAGAATVDLTALTRTALATVNLTGLRIRAMHIKALATNTAVVTIQPGATTGYAAMGLGLQLKPGGDAIIHDPTSDAVSALLKNIDLASTHLTASVNFVILAGTA